PPFLILPIPPQAVLTIFPYTTLFRSRRNLIGDRCDEWGIERSRAIGKQLGPQLDDNVSRPLEGLAWIVIHEGAQFSNGYRAVNEDRKSTRLNSSHLGISYAVFSSKKK